MFEYETTFEDVGGGYWELTNISLGLYVFIPEYYVDDWCDEFGWSIEDADIADKILLVYLAIKKYEEVKLERGLFNIKVMSLEEMHEYAENNPIDIPMPC